MSLKQLLFRFTVSQHSINRGQVTSTPHSTVGKFYYRADSMTLNWNSVMRLVECYPSRRRRQRLSNGC